MQCITNILFYSSFIRIILQHYLYDFYWRYFFLYIHSKQIAKAEAKKNEKKIVRVFRYVLRLNFGVEYTN